MQAAPAFLFWSKVAHRRLTPKRYGFDYRVFSLFININQLDKAKKLSPLFSINRLNIISFHEKDHGPRDGSNLQSWIVDVLSKQQILLDGGRIELLCFPRVLGYTFNPISLWFCHHEDGTLRAVLCEAHNTFGEAHSYLLHNDGHVLPNPVRREHDKNFHVSPFIDMNARYRFRISVPDEKLRVCIQEYQDDSLMLIASQTGERRDLNTINLLRAFFTMPLMTLKIMLLIHWQALKIWLRGIKYHPKPPAPRKDVS